MHGPHTILSVGRDASLLIHRHALLTRAGYAVTSAAQPVKAMHLLDSHAFDLIVVGGHGHTEHVWISSIEKDKNVRVVFLTCEHLRPDDEKCICADDETLRQVADALSCNLNR
jgi:DNA-binding response OmpR family regulator